MERRFIVQSMEIGECEGCARVILYPAQGDTGDDVDQIVELEMYQTTAESFSVGCAVTLKLERE